MCITCIYYNHISLWRRVSLKNISFSFQRCKLLSIHIKDKSDTISTTYSWLKNQNVANSKIVVCMCESVPGLRKHSRTFRLTLATLALWVGAERHRLGLFVENSFDEGKSSWRWAKRSRLFLTEERSAGIPITDLGLK